jgi:hypothetical protein
MRALYNIIIAVLLFSMAATIPQDTSDEVMDCASQAGPAAVYLRDFQVKLPAGGGAGERPPMYQQAVILRGNNIYRFNLCNKQGEAVIRIFDSNRMLVSSFDAAKGEDYNPVQFLCRKTGPYNIVITFKDNKAGEAIGIMSHVTISESRRSR